MRYRLFSHRTEATILDDVTFKTNLEHFVSALIETLEIYLHLVEQYPPSHLGKLVLRFQELSSQEANSPNTRETSFNVKGKPEYFKAILKACDFSDDEILTKKLERAQIDRLLHHLINQSLLSSELRMKLQFLLDQFSSTRDATEAELMDAGPPTKIQTLNCINNQVKNYTFSLEEGHIPGLSENICSIYLPFSAAVRIGAIVAWIAGHYIPDYVKYRFYTAAAVTTLTELLCVGIFGHYQVNPVDSLIRGRDHTMSQNILKTLKQNPKERTLLVTVGKLHVQGIVDLLKKEGFIEQTLN